MIWRLALDQLKQFEADLSNIKIDIKNVIDAANPKDLKQIQRRASDLKEQIKDSEVFLKYLVHKELARLRFRDANKDNELLICKTIRVTGWVIKNGKFCNKKWGFVLQKMGNFHPYLRLKILFIL